MNQLLHLPSDQLASAAGFSVRFDKNEFTGSRRARAASMQLMQAAQQLGPEAWIGCQIDCVSFSGWVFSSRGADVSAEDYSWIFQPCGEVSTESAAFANEDFYKNRFVYALVSSKAKASAADSFPVSLPADGKREDDPPEYILNDLLFETKEAGALLRVLVTSGEETAHGCILFSLPQKMPLRLKSMLSIAFPHTALLEVNAEQNASVDSELLRKQVLQGAAFSLLKAMMRQPREADKDNAERTDNRTPLFELKLSVRSFTCLKRAGYDTVEKVMRLTDEELMLVRNLNSKCVQEIHEKLKNFQQSDRSSATWETEELHELESELLESEPEPLKPVDHMAMLESLIGLQDVKEQIKRVAAFAKMKQAFAVSGKSDPGLTLNMAFVGNPGTAKTTVARIVAGILHEIGLLPSGDVLEAGRADLVARYVGNTAVEVRNLFERAKGRVLFIDEAYSLVDDRDGSFGDEAIHTIVQEMENHRHDTVVIFAGYPDKMAEFLARNPGLKSRVPFTVSFSDYSAEELLQIVGVEANSLGFSISEAAREKAKRLCLRAVGQPELGNGRFCRNLVENAMLNYAVRVFGDGKGDGEGDCVLMPEDFTEVDCEKEFRPIPIGFCA